MWGITEISNGCQIIWECQSDVLVHCTLSPCNASLLICLCAEADSRDSDVFAWGFYRLDQRLAPPCTCLSWNPPGNSLMTAGHYDGNSPSRSRGCNSNHICLLTFSFARRRLENQWAADAVKPRVDESSSQRVSKPFTTSVKYSWLLDEKSQNYGKRKSNRKKNSKKSD